MELASDIGQLFSYNPKTLSKLLWVENPHLILSRASMNKTIKTEYGFEVEIVFSHTSLPRKSGSFVLKQVHT